MSGGIYLEDGREIWGNTLSVCGGLFLIARHAQESSFLWRYLFDKSLKCAPFHSMDLRLLTDSNRDMFWKAAIAAYMEQVSVHGFWRKQGPNSYSYGFLHKLLLAHAEIEAGTSSGDADENIRWYLDDLDQIWLSDEELKIEFHKENAALIRHWQGLPKASVSPG